MGSQAYDLVIATFPVFLLIMVSFWYYYRRIKRVNEKYREAKDVIGEVIISFNKQLQRLERKVGGFSSETESLKSKIERFNEKLNEQNKDVIDLTAKVKSNLGTQRIPPQTVMINKKFEGLYATQKEMMKKIVEIEQTKYKFPISESKIGGVIPIKKERALAPLTKTELRVLEILADAEKTAPEVRDEIKLTREHTSRLMKTLYENGYLERDTRKIPYSYRVKEEMLKIMRGPEVRI